MQLREPVFLIGPPGSGKTTVGRLLASDFGVPFIDGDELVSQRAGIPIDELVTNWSAQERLDAQVAMLRELFAHPTHLCSQLREDQAPFVCAVPSGAVDAPVIQQALAKRATYFLDVSFADSFARTGLNAPRPVGLVAPRALWRQLMAERRPRYLASAKWVIETNNLDVGQVTSVLKKGLSNGN
ncbi:MAG: shikimate kinase [Bowdeniella nasicola]|nr:shikimate kinase [Bowdeniella nasicola]